MRTSKWNLLGLGCVVLLVLAPSFSAFAALVCNDLGLGADPCDPDAGHDVCEYYGSNYLYRCLYFDASDDTITAISEDEGANGYAVMFGTTTAGDFCCDYTDFAGGETAMHQILINTGDGDDLINLTYDAGVAVFQWNHRSKVYAGDGNDTVYGSDWGEGSGICEWNGALATPCDYIHTGLGEDCVYAGAGDDEIIAANNDDYPDYLDGGDDNDKIWGGAQGDDIVGGGDTDVLRGGGGADTINGNDGMDWILGNDGDDYLYGDAGYDYAVCGGSGADYVDGGSGSNAAICTDTTDATYFCISVVDNCPAPPF